VSGRASGWLVAALVFGVLAWALLGLPSPTASLTDEAFVMLDQSGVTNPVTAVLLNYRSYDTLLELGVLLLAVVGVWSLRRTDVSQFAEPAGPLLEALLRFVLPLLLVAAGYLLWLGSSAPGGAFQGGALIGGAIVLMLLAGHVRVPLGGRSGWLGVGLWLGLVVFSAVGLAMALGGRRFLEYPPDHAGSLILLIETAAMVSIGLTLGCLFLGGRPGPPPEEPGDS
jgi:multisubunit Na+/H+ antiporter MnhB subunit